MLSKSVLRFVLLGTGMLTACELVYYGFGYVKRWLPTMFNHFSNGIDTWPLISKRSVDINEVLWTNELAALCNYHHTNNGMSFSKENDSGNQRQVSIDKSMNLLDPTMCCSNPSCADAKITRILTYLDSAHYSIDLAMYVFTTRKPAEALIRAVRRGVSVRVITDGEMAYINGSQCPKLSNNGVAVRSNGKTMLMHHKFCVIDSPLRIRVLQANNNLTDKQKTTVKTRGILMTGSLNWTTQGFSNNWENILITSQQNLVEKYSEEFDRLWNIF